MGFIPFSLIDLIDILLFAGLLFIIWKATRGTNAPYIFAGIIIIYLSWVIVKAFNMELLSNVLGQVISVGVIALVILFQPEIRRFLLMVGMRQKQLNFIARIFNQQPDAETLDISPIVTACLEMSETKTGVLIVIQRKNNLFSIVEGGIPVDAKITVSLLKNIFFKNAPLHDGAVVINDNRVVAAKCILPVTQSDVPKEYGTRHRAAIGISETSDAVVVVVSEETGSISIARHGELKHNIEHERFARELRHALRNSR